MFEKALGKIEKRIDKVAVEAKQPIVFKKLLITNPTLAVAVATLLVNSPMVKFAQVNAHNFPNQNIGALTDYYVVLEHQKSLIIKLVFDNVLIELEGKKISLWFDTILYSFTLDKRLSNSYGLVGYDFTMFDENKFGEFIVELEKKVESNKKLLVK